MAFAKIAHLTSVHFRYDTRIFLKECTSLVTAGYETHLIVADGKGDEQKNNIFIHDTGASKHRLDRILNSPSRLLQKALSLNADIYHLHDPELLYIGLKLKKAGKKVIFDAHEDIVKDILTKEYLRGTNKVISYIYGIYEYWICSKLDFVVAATPFIRDKYQSTGIKTIDINNFPLLKELAPEEIDWKKKYNQVCYIGDITRIRGILEIVQAMEQVKNNTKLLLAGSFSDHNLESSILLEEGWKKVEALGFLDRQSVSVVLQQAIAGLITFLPVPNHIDAQPNKMFEYMSAGIPVIASNFLLWRDIIEGNNCGICIDPHDPQAIAQVIDYLATNPVEAEKLGRNGQKAVEEKYNWALEEKKLLQLYERL